MDGKEAADKKEWLRRVILTAKNHVDFGAQVPQVLSMYFTDEFGFENTEAEAVLKEATVPVPL
jgi:nondiscriminating glutamyl-tRNA synthetase